MKIYYTPINLHVENIFEKMRYPRDVITTFAVKSMEVGDLVLFNIGLQQQDYEAGVYAYGEVIRDPYFFLDDEYDLCYGQRCVDVRIIDIDTDKPLVPSGQIYDYFVPCNRRHVLKEEDYGSILELLKAD